MKETEPQAGGFTLRLIKWPLSGVLTSCPSGLGNLSNFAPLLLQTVIFLVRKKKQKTCLSDAVGAEITEEEKRGKKGKEGFLSGRCGSEGSRYQTRAKHKTSRAASTM